MDLYQIMPSEKLQITDMVESDSSLISNAL